MEIFKVGVVVAAGLGSTWAARTVTDGWLGLAPPAVQVAQAPEAQGDAQREPAAPGETAQAPVATGKEPAQDAGAGSAPPVTEISREEMEKELERARAEIAGKPAQGELEEFRPSRPLAADVAIALPSDM